MVSRRQQKMPEGMKQPVLPEEIRQEETERSHIQAEENASSLDRSMDHRHGFRLYQDNRHSGRQHGYEGQKDKCGHRSPKAESAETGQGTERLTV